MRAMAVKKYRLQPVLGARAQSKREAERLLAAAGVGQSALLVIARSDAMNAFLRQGTSEKAPPANTLTQLQKMF